MPKHNLPPKKLLAFSNGSNVVRKTASGHKTIHSSVVRMIFACRKSEPKLACAANCKNDFDTLDFVRLC